jgi:3-deoxy-manno-octulosonate cytidylyltransferase (CMP-KDO synthetase)
MANMPKILGVIPARLDSKRLPRKVLRDIAGKPMIYWVYRNARRSTLITEVLVATDSEEVQDYCLSENIPVLMTGPHPSGSDRLHEVMLRTDAEIYANIQGDEPTLRPDHLELLLSAFVTGRAQVTTLKVALDPEHAADPNTVKVVTDYSGRALYFSRHAIPFDRDSAGGVQYYKHIGLYAYTRQALMQFHSLPQSSLEIAEKLEQLRFLQNGIPVTVLETPHDTIGVDTEADLAQVNLLFSNR